MKLIKIKLATMLMALAFSGAVAAANAPTTTPLGTLVGGSVTSFEHLGMAAGSFNDSFTFSVGLNDGTFWDTFATRMRVTSGFVSTLNSLNSELLQGVTVVATGTNELTGWSRTTVGETGPQTGGFTLRLWGEAKANGGYTGTLSVTPVPEPGEWALMISGLGLIGFMVRRRTSGGT